VKLVPKIRSMAPGPGWRRAGGHRGELPGQRGHRGRQTLAEPTSDADAIRQAALAALDKFTDRRRPVRLLGVRAEFADAER
jgi:nucleotidyltransferase/DNA polymerase involved in DNA repair